MTRRELKQQSETASIETALQILHPLSYILGSPPEIIDKPNPPDAIIRIGNKITWMEHTDAYRTNDEARELWSYIVPEEKPYNRREQIICEPDERMAMSILNAMAKKMKKDSYATAYEKHGPGTLIITERDDLFSDSTLETLKEYATDLYPSVCWKKQLGIKDYFDKVYLLCSRSNFLIKIFPKFGTLLSRK